MELRVSERESHPRPHDGVVVDERDRPSIITSSAWLGLGVTGTGWAVLHGVIRSFPSESSSPASVTLASDDYLLPEAGKLEARLGDSEDLHCGHTCLVTPELQLENVSKPDEAEAILTWRMRVLDRAGYDPDAAAALACSTEVDLHVAVRLLERGCPAETALRILL